MTDLSLLQDFVAETVEHLEEMEGNLLQLERDPDNGATLNHIFRSVHTIKGAAEYMGMERIAELSHRLENLLDLMRHRRQTATRDIIDLLMTARDRLGALTADLHQNQTEQTEIADLLNRIESVRQADATDDEEAPSPDGEGAAMSSLPSRGGEIYEEEHDEELFSIFLEQLQEGIDALQAWTGALSEADPVDRVDLLGRCLSQIDPLRSSANYMGYDELVALYDAWQTAIQDAREHLKDGDDGFLQEFIDHAMQERIATIREAFPRLSPRENPTPASPFEGDEETFSFIEEDVDDTGQAAASNSDETVAPEDRSANPPAPFSEAFAPGELKLFPGENQEGEPDPSPEENASSLDPGLLQDFVDETFEHLGEMENSVLQLEANPEDTDTLNDIFRCVHTIKGAAEYMGMGRTADLAHHLENLLDLMRKGKSTANRDVVDLIMSSRDRIGALNADLQQTRTERTDIDDLLERLRSLLDGDGSRDAPQPPSPDPITSSKGGMPENDIYEEENDEELFSIFLEQLQEGLDILQSHTDAMADADRRERIDLLEACLVQIDPLRSSANYMGYRRLTGLYDRWREAIQTARERLQGQEEAFVPAFIAGCMQATLDDVRRCFPSLASSPDTAADNACEAVDDAWSSAQTGASTDQPPDLLDAFAKAPEAAPDQASTAAIGETAVEDRSLFDQLSRSFDQHWAENEKEGHGAQPTGMEMELFSEADAAAHAADALEQTRTPFFETRDLRNFDAEGVGSLPPDQPAELKSPDENPPPPSATEDPETADAAIDPLDALKENDAANSDRNPENDTPAAEETAAGLLEAPSTAAGTEIPFDEQASDEQVSTDAGEAATTPAAPAPDVEAPSPQTKSSPETFDLDRSPGDRRDPYQKGRRKSDRVGEQLLRQSIRVDAAKIDALMNQVGELVVSRAWFSQLFHEMRDLQQNLQHNADLEAREMKQVKGLTFRLSEATVALGRVANELQEGVMKVRMLPIAQLFNRYPRLVFDLVRESDKEVALDIKGEETELDKMVIEAISDPLIHIIRNAVDHGLEPAEERRRLGKPESGTIHLEAYHEGNHVVIEIADDGRGLDAERIKAKALAGKFATREEINRMPPKEINSLIMQPGFSTAVEVTHTSGRGVGMDVVKQNIEKLNGTIEIDTTPGVGTQFRIKIPLTLAIIPALLVQVSGELFTIPLSTVEETIRIAPQDLSTIEGVEVMQLRESTLPLVRLGELFKMTPQSSSDGRSFVVVVSTGMKQVGLVVDALLGQEEVVIKPLEDYLQEKSGFSGATILGDGRISLILDIYELVNLSIDRQSQRNQVAVPA